ncbi:MAG TPA: hypothetical protein VEF04_04690 [Blastocatellia bacterium]|nr:hypothetical protein [Blastocatellia bacterium]
MAERIYTTKEAAEMLEVTEGRVRQLIQELGIQTQRFGNAHVISQKTLDALKKRNPRGRPPKKPDGKHGSERKRRS